MIAYGITNSGDIDLGGVRRVIKGNTDTKEWFSDVLPTSTEYEIVGVNVHEITSQGSASAIANDRALYVIEVPDSDRAPHQSKRDHLYYVRLARQSLPASHRMIEDIRNRRVHPQIAVGLELLPRISGSPTLFRLRISLENSGRIKAGNVCLLLELPSCGRGLLVPGREDFLKIVDARRGGRPNEGFFELRHPLYPEMQTAFQVNFTLPVRVIAINAGLVRLALEDMSEDIAGANIGWTVFADSAPPKRGTSSLGDLGFYSVPVP